MQIDNSSVPAFVVKVAGRCNLNCKYCYMYNLADTSWRKQPKFLSEPDFRLLCSRIRDHVVTHSLKRITFVLHGGEPLLLGAAVMDRYLSIFWEALSGIDVVVNLGMQSNGLLLTEEIGAVLKKHHATVGVSIDGVPGKGDSERVDHQGRPSGLKLEKALKAFLEAGYREQFSGFIAVANIEHDPRETYRYLASFNPPAIDFRLPLNHHSNLPKRLSDDLNHTGYGEWYSEIFDELMKSEKKIPIRFLTAIVHGMAAQPTSDLYWGNQEPRVVIVESDGSFELVDNLKAIGDGLTKTGLNVRENSLDEFVEFRNSWLQRIELNDIPKGCHSCPLVEACRGCFYISRYAEGSGFSKQSVYCNDMKYLIPKMFEQLSVA